MAYRKYNRGITNDGNLYNEGNDHKTVEEDMLCMHKVLDSIPGVSNKKVLKWKVFGKTLVRYCQSE